MLYSQLAYTLALAATAAASGLSSVRLTARQVDCTERCEPLEVLERFDCIPTKPGCSYCTAVQGMIDDIATCYQCIFANQENPDRSLIREAYEHTVEECASVGVDFDVPDFGEDQDRGAGGDEQGNGSDDPEGSDTDGNSGDGELGGQDGANEEEPEGSAVQAAVSSSAILALGAMFTSMLM